jgi:spermidine synthase
MRKSLLVLLIFTLSGAAGLVYEIVWSRQLVLVFGNTTQAVTAILTGFFGGLAIGAFVGGRLADRVRSPLRMYGILELLLVGVVLLTPLSFRLINDVYQGIYPSIEGTPWLPILRLVLAVLAVSPATILMGATFPSLVRHFTRAAGLSVAFGRLYAANTIGAIAGTLMAGIVLIELFGLSGALRVGAGCSLIAGLSALWLARGSATDGTTAPAPLPTPAPAAPGDPASTLGSTPSIARPQLALIVAFLSGLTSLAYQVTWTRLLASGTGNTTYVFTVILAIFLTGIAIGALLYNLLRSRFGDPVRLLAFTQIALAVLAIVGLVAVISQPHTFDPSAPLDTIKTLVVSATLVVLPATIILGIAFPTASALLRDEARESGRESGSLLASNTTGAILGSLLVPFILMPTIGSPAIIVLLAVTNATVGIALALVSRPPARPTVGFGIVTLVGVAIVVASGAVVQPNVAFIQAANGTLFASTEDEIASVQAGQVRPTPELWVAGTSMTLLTVDAKLMPILPLIARPDAERALVVAFGMGTAFRAALTAGLRTDVVELVPSVPKMFGYYYPDASAVLANPDGKVIVADGRNHLELTDERFDIIVTDPPPPIESSGASVISSQEYYQAGHDHLTPDGIMMQWVPYGSQDGEFRDHLRTFATVFPNVVVVRGAGGYGQYMLGSDAPITFPPDAIRTALERPGVLEDISSAYDSPTDTIDGWIDVIGKLQWLSGDAVAAYAGPGPLITDDQPRPEYFLLRRLFGIGAEPPAPGG